MSLTTKDLIELVRKELNKYLLGLDTRMKIESEIESFEQKRKEWIEKQKNFKMGKKTYIMGRSVGKTMLIYGRNIEDSYYSDTLTLTFYTECHSNLDTLFSIGGILVYVYAYTLSLFNGHSTPNNIYIFSIFDFYK